MKTAATAVLLLLVTGCGSDVVISAEPVDDPYDGPLHVEVTQPDHPDPLVRSGAAGMALECAGEPYSGSTGSNWGVTSGEGEAVGALEDFVADEVASVPKSGYRTEREEADRVLFSYDAAGKTKVAIIVADGVTADSGETGWGMETFAECDPAELPDSVTDALGIQVWVDQTGERVPTTILQSTMGPVHCEWDSATFLEFQGGTYIKDPEGVLPPQWFDTTFDADVRLPDDAIDTGYSLDGQRLWVSPDQSTVYVVTGQRVEPWRAPTKFVGCA